MSDAEFPESISFSGRVYVITGASGGIGSALAHELAFRGARLALIARNEDRLISLAQSLPFSTEPHRAFVADVTSSEQIKDTFARVAQEMGPIAGAAHCVGSILLRPAHLLKDEDWHQTLALNLHSAFFVLRESITALQKGSGSIVFCSSSAARIGLMNHEAVAAAKAGIEGMVRSAAATYASRGIRINAVAPGLVDTPLSARITQSEPALKASVALHPLRRVGTPQDVSRALTWFLDPSQSWVTGQILGVDGGLGSLKTPAV